MNLARLLAKGFSMSLRRSVAFRVDLLVGIAMSCVRIGSLIVTVLVIFSRTTSLAGWDRTQVLILVGTFQLLTGLKATFLDPNLSWFPENGVRNGKLDLYLLQPVPSIYLASLSTASPLPLTQSALGLVVAATATANLHHPPGAAAILCWLILVTVGIVMTWAVGVVLACLAFWAPKLQLDIFYSSVWQLAGYPVSIYHKALRLTLTYVFPTVLIATVPATALTHGPHLMTLGFAISAAFGGVAMAVGIWRVGLRRYTGATS